MLKQIPDEPSILLLKTERGNGVYSFQAKDGSFTAFPDEEWQKRSGAAKTCQSEFQSINEFDNLGRGEHTIYAIPDSRATRTAVLSVTASKPTSSLPRINFPGMVTEPAIQGDRHFDIVGSDEKRTRSHSYRIRDQETSTPRMCWSPKENFVVVYDNTFSSISVIILNDFKE